jgi:hypothetical protein
LCKSTLDDSEVDFRNGIDEVLPQRATGTTVPKRLHIFQGSSEKDTPSYREAMASQMTYSLKAQTLREDITNVKTHSSNDAFEQR